MFSLLFSGIGPSFQINSLSCVDHGANQRYCPRQDYPPFNKGFAPTRAKLHVEGGELLPRTIRETDDEIALEFMYDVTCMKRNIKRQCTLGNVTMQIHPRPKWDRPTRWWQYVIELLCCFAVFYFGGPVVLIMFLSQDARPEYKRSAFFSDY